MPLMKKCLRANSSIVQLQELHDDQLGVVTAKDGIYILQGENCKISTRMRIDELRPFEHGVAFSPDGRYFCFAHNTSKGNAIRVIDIATKKLLRSYATQDNPIGLLSFDPSSTYIIAGTTTGRVMVWRIDSNNLMARLSSFPEYTPTLFSAPTQNYISAIAYSPTHIATAGYGGSVVITNFHTQANTKRIKPGKVRINSILFLDDQYIVTGNEHGVIELIDIKENQPIQQLVAPIGPIHHLLLIRPSGLILAASKFNHIALIDIKNMRIIDDEYITLPSPIRSLCFTGKERIAVGLESGTIAQVELLPYAEIKESIDNGDFEHAYAVSEAEPIIKESPQYKAMDRQFQRDYDKALLAYSRGSDEEAEELLRAFRAVPNKKKIVQGLSSAFSRYSKFQHLLKEKRYAAVYGLAEQYPPLKQTYIYKRLEEQWDELYVDAQALAFKGHTSQVKTLLKDFITVPAKNPYIRLLLHHTQILIDFSKALHAQDYVALKQVTEQEPILKETLSYRSVIHAADGLIESIMSAIRSNRFNKAHLLTEKLQDIPHLAHHHEHTARLLKKAKRLYEIHTDKMTLQYYELLDRSQDLADLPQAKAVEKAWKRIMIRCEKEALIGNTAEIKSILGPLIDLPTRAEKIGNILRVSYQMQIKYYLAHKQYIQTRTAIVHYLSLFGMDNEIRQLIRHLNKAGMPFTPDEEQEVHRPRTLWRTLTHGDVPDNIIMLS